MDMVTSRVLATFRTMSFRFSSTFLPRRFSLVALATLSLGFSLSSRAQAQDTPPAPPAQPTPPATAQPGPSPDAPPEPPAPPQNPAPAEPDAGAAPAPGAPAGSAPAPSTSATPPAPAAPPTAPPSPAEGAAQETTELGAVVVQENALNASEAAADRLNDVNGGTNLVRAQDFSRGTVGTVADVLKYQPGIYAQSVNGGEATRLSIRGSGVVRSGFLFGWGNVLNLDGQRLYGASGNPYEAIEPLAVDHVEVLRGANAFEYGPLSLGGSINYVTKTGYDASPFQARVELGSYGYHREQVSSGTVVGPWDYYVTATRFDKEGYRDNTRSYSTRFVSTLGYQINKNTSTRFFFRAVEQYQEDAGFLTKAQFESNPRQSQFGTQVRDRVNRGTFVVGNTTKYRIDENSKVEVGGQYDSSPIDTPHGGPTAVFFKFQQIAASVRYERSDDLAGHDSNTLVSFIGHHTLHNDWRSFVLATNTLSADRPAEQADYTFLATNDTALIKHLWLGLGAAGIFQHRETSVTAGQALVGKDIAVEYASFAPKAALRYELTPRTHLFANVSRSIDTPSANSYIRTDPLYVPLGFLPLKKASAGTAEGGTRGREGIVAWNVSYYYSWITNELLTVQIAPMVTTSSNASPTIHQGVEAGLDLQLWRQRRAGKDPDDEQQQQIVLRQSYTWNDFRFKDDPLFGHNRLAGVPIHLYRAELAYEHASGFYVGANVEASLGQFPGDFANTIYAPAYAIAGARLGFQQPRKGIEAFVELRNAFNTKYAPVVGPIFNAQHVDSNVYAPGEGRALNAGAAYRF